MSSSSPRIFKAFKKTFKKIDVYLISPIIFVSTTLFLNFNLVRKVSFTVHHNLLVFFIWLIFRIQIAVVLPPFIFENCFVYLLGTKLCKKLWRIFIEDSLVQKTHYYTPSIKRRKIKFSEMLVLKLPISNTKTSFPE